MPGKAPDAVKSAVALAYRETDAAPRVVAKGRGLVAEEIIARARAHGVYVHESPELVSLLVQVDLDERIPAQLYVAVAELLAWLYRLENGGTDMPPPPGIPSIPMA
ncbi:EscU/YscU/HrcU family type III secretion system export apparatus switch protein [Rhodocyclus tenuis]|uniref:Flagellar biosynthesis protein n=1 Tax=Rhodocyclus tenuis TaxID=1066 RepID=A0A840G2N6_RHOTE|nr:EscU/YscU/HrcU family type III secretion system export apparatus switch protein [Rhodocyclus tenuis]MBB4246673.1 flagellar biosynthesis protein [Rhodocyclus tenuis]MBK1679968.1 flagellar biosynthesis protein [Rhodocyclus tenuis]